GGDLRYLLRSLCVGEIRLRLSQLLVELRRVDLREQLPGFHRRADVDEPAFQIAARARVDRRIRVRLDVARQGEHGIAALGLWPRGRHSHEGARFGVHLQLCACALGGENAPHHNTYRHHTGDRTDAGDAE